MKKWTLNPTALFFAITFTTLFLQSQGHCSQTEDFDKVSKSVMDLLMGPGIRKAALTLGMGAGLIQAFMAGSLRPLLIYGGLGLVVCYLPALIQAISNISVAA